VCEDSDSDRTELLLRLLVHRIFFFVGANARFNMFDFVLVFFGVFEQALIFIRASQQFGANMTFLRIIRLTKLFRAFRVLRVIRMLTEMRTMLAAIAGSLRSQAIVYSIMAFFVFFFCLALWLICII